MTDGLRMPGDGVLIDARCCSRCDRTFFARGDRGRVEAVARNGELLVRIERTSRSTWFLPGDVVPVPHNAPTYPCCAHCACHDRPGHSQPCTGCRQGERDSADRQAARAMNQAGSTSVAAVLLLGIFGSLLFLALLTGGQRLMCHAYHGQIRYCPGYTAAQR